MTPEELAVFATLTALSKIIKDNLPDFSYLNYQEKRSQMRRKLNELSEQKALFLRNIDRLYAHPRFNVEEPTMNPRLLSTFYDIAIDVTKTLTIKEENFSYYEGIILHIMCKTRPNYYRFLLYKKKIPKDTILGINYQSPPKKDFPFSVITYHCSESLGLSGLVLAISPSCCKGSK